MFEDRIQHEWEKFVKPFHQPYPWVYRNAELTVVEVSCDPDELDRVLPESLTARRPVTAVAWTLSCEGIAGAGSYQEFIFNVVAHDGEQSRLVTPYIYVNNDAAMASGREVLGVPKRMADIDHGYHQDQRIAHIQRSGIEFATLGMTLDQEGDNEDAVRYSAAFSRPTLTRVNGQLMSGEIETTVHRVVHGQGFIDSRASAADPFYKLGAVATGHAAFLTVDIVLKQPVPVDEQSEGR